MAHFLEDSGKKALTTAVKNVEKKSAAEIVIAVRRQSHNYVHVYLLIAFLVYIATLSTMIFVDEPFSHHALILDPLFAAMLFGYCSSHVTPLKRWLTPVSVRKRWVAMTAKATFYEKGIHNTLKRTGLLVFISLVENTIYLVADTGILKAVEGKGWCESVSRFESAIKGHDALHVAKELEILGTLLADVLPVQKDDVNELSDEVCG